jgi:predicted ArsR family transcriptional regulator
MQINRSRELIRMFVERIVNETFPDETAAARLQQVGLFTLIYMLQGEEQPVTAARLAKMTGLSDAQVITHLRKLIDRDLIEREQILNKQGRGRAFHLSIKHNAKSRRLAKAIEKSGARKKR